MVPVERSVSVIDEVEEPIAGPSGAAALDLPGSDLDTDEESIFSDTDDDDNIEQPSNNPLTASERKLGPSSGLSELEEKSFSVFPTSINTLSDMFGKVACQSCGQCGIEFKCEGGHGVVCKLGLLCVSCGWTSSSYSSPALDPRANLFEINRRAVNGFMQIGKGYQAFALFCASMDMPCMAKASFQRNKELIAEKHLEMADQVLKEAREKVEQAHIDAGNTRNEEGFLDITVSFDATWQKRGFVSNYGIGFVIDIFTGLVLDYECLSKHCRKCTLKLSVCQESSAEFKLWYETHAPTCKKNWAKSSPAMEMAMCSILWNRSVSKCGMRYTTLLSDGDAKSYAHLCSILPYGPDVPIAKEECVNHVAKRLGKGLRDLKKKEKLGGKGAGNLTDSVIVKLTNYYGHAVRHNKTVTEMRSAIYATLFHYHSTDAKPRHMKCPTGEKSWCFYNRSLALKQTPQAHNEAMTTQVNLRVFQAILPLYHRLANEDLLARCLSGKTQNANESLHSVLWANCPKSVFVGKSKLLSAIAIAIGKWNQGLQKSFSTAMELLQTPPHQLAKRLTRRIDQERLRQSVVASDKNFQRERRYEKLLKLRNEEQMKNTEGTTYESGGY